MGCWSKTERARASLLGGRWVLITQLQLRLSEVCSSGSAECILGYILGISESLTQKPTRIFYNNLPSNKMSNALQMLFRSYKVSRRHQLYTASKLTVRCYISNLHVTCKLKIFVFCQLQAHSQRTCHVEREQK